MGIHNQRHNELSADHIEVDPGDAGTIRALGSQSYYGLVSAAAETRTVADPIKPGLQLIIGMTTDGGDITITFSSKVNETGNNTLVLANAGENMFFHSVEDSAGVYRWQALAPSPEADGPALSTV